MSSTLTTLMQRALYELDAGFVIPNADISAIAATSFTAARWGQNSNQGGGDLQGKQSGFVRAGAASSADFWRPAGSVTIASGVFNQAGSNWADTTVGSEEIEVWHYGVRRDQEVLKSLQRVVEFRYLTTMLAVSHLSGLDGDMALSTDTNWTDLGTPTTSAKATTAQRTPWGINNYHIVTDAVGEGTVSAQVLTRQGCNVSAHTIIAADSGTVSFQVRNVAAATLIGTAVTHSERRAQLMTIQNQTIDSTCKVVAGQASGTVNPTDFYMNQMWLYNMDNPVCPLPALVTESFMAPKLVQMVPRYSTGSNVYDAEGLEPVPLTEGVDYWLVINYNDAQPYKVRFRDTSYYQYPIMVEARVPQSAFVTPSAETDAVVVPLHEILPAFKKDLLETVYNTGIRRLPDWDRQYNLANMQLTKATKARQVASVSPAKPYWSPMLSA